MRIAQLLSRSIKCYGIPTGNFPQAILTAESGFSGNLNLQPMEPCKCI